MLGDRRAVVWLLLLPAVAITFSSCSKHDPQPPVASTGRGTETAVTNRSASTGDCALKAGWLSWIDDHSKAQAMYRFYLGQRGGIRWGQDVEAHNSLMVTQSRESLTRVPMFNISADDVARLSSEGVFYTLQTVLAQRAAFELGRLRAVDTSALVTKLKASERIDELASSINELLEVAVSDKNASRRVRALSTRERPLGIQYVLENFRALLFARMRDQLLENSGRQEQGVQAEPSEDAVVDAFSRLLAAGNCTEASLPFERQMFQPSQ